MRTLAAVPVIAAVALAAAPAAALADTITGTVTTSGGTALGGATVQAETPSSGAVVATATTAGNGSYTLSGLTTSSNYVVQFSDSGYATQYYNDETQFYAADQVTAPGTGIDAALQPAGGISGTVTGSLGGGNVEITVEDAAGNCSGGSGTCQTTTNSDGTYSLSGLLPGTYFLEATPLGSQNYIQDWYGDTPYSSQAVPVTVTAGSTTNPVNFAMSVGGVITGQVTDPQTGGAASGIEVQAESSDGETTYGSATTDANGNYAINGLPTGSYKVEFYDFGGNYLDEYYGGTAAAESGTSVSVTAGVATPGINMSLPEASQGGTISGTVTNGSTGAAVSGVSVDLFDANNNSIPMSTTTGSDGSYTVSGLVPGTYKVEFAPRTGNLAYQFYAGKISLATANTVTVGAGQTVPGVSAGLTTGGSISGTVTDKASGSGLADATIDLEDGSGNVLATTSTRPDGSYVLGGIPSGAGYHVEFDGPIVNGGGFYANQWWNDSLTFGSSSTLAINAGTNTPGINAALSTYAATTTPVQVVTTPAPPAKPKPGKPTTSHGKLSGLSHSRASLRFTVTSGSHGAAKLKSIKVTLPKGLSFVTKGLKHGLALKGAGRYKAKISHGALTITLKKPAHRVTVTIRSAALKVSRKLAAEARKHKDKTVKVRVQVTNAKHQKTKLTLTFRKPS